MRAKLKGIRKFSFKTLAYFTKEFYICNTIQSHSMMIMILHVISLSIIISELIVVSR